MAPLLYNAPYFGILGNEIPVLIEVGEERLEFCCLSFFSWPLSVACLKSTVLKVVVSGRKTDDRKDQKDLKEGFFG